MMIDSRDTAFNETPKAFNGVCMDIAGDVYLGGMFDRRMIESPLPKSIVSPILISVNDRSNFNRILDYGKHCTGLGIRDDNGFYPAPTLDYAHDRSFTSSTTSALAGSSTAKVRFVNLNFAGHGVGTFVKFFPDKCAHSPSGFVCDASFPLDLLGGNSASSLSHEIDGIEPKGKAGSGFVKDGIRCGMDMMPTLLTTKGAARGH